VSYNLDPVALQRLMELAERAYLEWRRGLSGEHLEHLALARLEELERMRWRPTTGASKLSLAYTLLLIAHHELEHAFPSFYGLAKWVAAERRRRGVPVSFRTAYAQLEYACKAGFLLVLRSRGRLVVALSPAAIELLASLFSFSEGSEKRYGKGKELEGKGGSKTYRNYLF